MLVRPSQRRGFVRAVGRHSPWVAFRRPRRSALTRTEVGSAMSAWPSIGRKRGWTARCVRRSSAGRPYELLVMTQETWDTSRARSPECTRVPTKFASRARRPRWSGQRGVQSIRGRPSLQLRPLDMGRHPRLSARRGSAWPYAPGLHRSSRQLGRRGPSIELARLPSRTAVRLRTRGNRRTILSMSRDRRRRTSGRREPERGREQRAPVGAH